MMKGKMPNAGNKLVIETGPWTNGDAIRDMTDEELAEWLERIRLCCATDSCGRSCPLKEICYSNAEAPKETLDWLKQEAADDKLSELRSAD